MKREKMITWACIAFTCVPVCSNAQTLKDILNSDVVKNTITTITGGKPLSSQTIAGTWTYVKPAVQLKGDNALKNIAGTVATAELEKKLKQSCAKVGIVEGLYKYTFNEDSTFTCTTKGRVLKGTYSINSTEKTVDLQYGKFGKFSLLKMTAHLEISGNSLSLLFPADKLLDFIAKLSVVSQNNTLQAIGKLAGQYENLLLGFELQK